MSPDYQPNALATWLLHFFLSPRSLKPVVCWLGLYCNNPTRDCWASSVTEPSTVFRGWAKTKIISHLKLHFLNMASYNLYFWKVNMLFSPHKNDKFILKGMVPVTSMLMLQIISAKIAVPASESAVTLNWPLCNSIGSSLKLLMLYLAENEMGINPLWPLCQLCRAGSVVADRNMRLQFILQLADNTDWWCLWLSLECGCQGWL